MGQDSATFRDKGTEVPSLKGQQDKLKILPKDGTGWDSLSKSGTGSMTGPDSDNLSVPDRTKRDRAEKGILKQEKDIRKHKKTF
jgi:hypothetical protein